MAAKIVRLRTKTDQIQADKAEKLRQLVTEFPGLPEGASSEIIAAIDRRTAADHGWTFVMMSPENNAKVVDWLLSNSTRPQLAVRLWSQLFLHLKRDGEIMQTREALAEAVHATPNHISRVMGELEAFGAISRERVKVAGMRGPGVVRYRMNPVIATTLTGQARDKAQAAAPMLQLVK